MRNTGITDTDHSMKSVSGIGSLHMCNTGIPCYRSKEVSGIGSLHILAFPVTDTDLSMKEGGKAWI